MQLSSEMFFSLFAVLMVVATIWFLRSASAYKTWAKSHYKSATPTRASGSGLNELRGLGPALAGRNSTFLLSTREGRPFK